MQGETAKPPNFDSLAGGKNLAHMLDQRLYGKLHILVGEMLLIGSNELDQLRLGHHVYQQTRGIVPLAIRQSGRTAI